MMVQLQIIIHDFTINCKNDTGSSLSSTVRLKITDGNNVEVFNESRTSQDIPAGGTTAVNFTWAPRAQFMKYVATAEIWNGSTLLDTTALDFHGTVVETKSGHKLYVNGEEFFIKGLNGAAKLMDDECDKGYLELAKLAGANAIRADSPSPRLAKIAGDYGLMLLTLAPDSCRDFTDLLNAFYDNSLDSDKSRMQIESQILALKEFPNILSWGLGNEFGGTRYSDFTTFLSNRDDASDSLDEYNRPSLYSNHNGDYISSGADIMAFNLYDHPRTDYEERINSLNDNVPAVLTEWGIYKSIYDHRDYEETIDHITKRMYDSVLPQGWAGAFYFSGLTDYDYVHPGLAASANTLDYNPQMIEGIKNLYDDVAVKYEYVDSSGIKLWFKNRRPYRLENVKLTIVTPSNSVIEYNSTGDMEPGEEIETGSLNIGETGNINLYFDYTTHGGLGGIGPEASFFFNTGKEILPDDAVIEDFDSIDDWVLGTANMPVYRLACDNGIAEMYYNERAGSRDILYYDFNDTNFNISGYNYLSVDARIEPGSFLTLETWIDGVYKRQVGYYAGNGTDDFEKLYFRISGDNLEKLRLGVSEMDGNIGGISGQRMSVYFKDVRVMRYIDADVLDDFDNYANKWTLGAASNGLNYGMNLSNG